MKWVAIHMQALRERANSLHPKMTIAAPIMKTESPAYRTHRLYHANWSLALVGFGIALSAAWTAFLGYMLILAIIDVAFLP